MFLRTSAASFSNNAGGTLKGKDMYEEGFDIEAVAQRLRTTFPVEQGLPFNFKLLIAHLMRAENEAEFNR